MLKASCQRRILTATIALIIVSILYFFPNNKTYQDIPKTTNYLTPHTEPIYLLNKDNYVIRTDYNIKELDDLSKVKELISALTIKSDKSKNLPSTLKPIIPQNTKIKSLSLEEDLLKINFSKEFLNTTKEEEEKLIESIVYTLTEIPSIKKIMIFVDEKKLEYLPQSNIKLPSVLDRNIGINKTYDITDFKNLTKTTIYYIGKENDFIYYIPVTKIDNNNENKIEIIINELKSSPIYETNLISYLASSVQLLNYETLEDEINLTFNNEIFSDLSNKNILEEVKYSIALSIKDTMHINTVNFIVEDKIISTFNPS